MSTVKPPLMRVKCKHCKTIVAPTRFGEWACCSCFKNESENTGFYIDIMYRNKETGSLMYRSGGNFANMELIKDEE